ncbi:amidohydrolase family protein [Paenibacillus thermotolerans]|uniref:amidohydrolase family protein n=1 Tax=Paenibacillus thermotolerans TaxID=3027807 RepID=UPI0023674E66|nr:MULTISPECIES: amidohydrolase family protein [unclassified Paenibacillus]
MRIDAHQHYWKIGRGDYGWLTPSAGILHRDYMPADLAPELKANGIEKTVAVQAAPTVAETEFLLELCERENSLAGVVGWLDLEGGGFEEQLLRLKRNPYFLGIRPMLQDLEDDAYILRPKVLESLRLLAEHQVRFDVLVFPRHLPHIVTLLERVPGLKAVVDHLAKPSIAEGITEPWGSLMRDIASYPNVYCKLSGMVTEALHQAWKQEDFVPYVHHVIDAFGTSRVMFGSDWPVCLLSASDYGEVVAVLERALPDGMSEREKERLFGLNAAEFYGLDPATGVRNW